MATVTCPGCQERDERIAALERRVAELEATVRDLTARLGTNATNSGTPPSANPPGAPKPPDLKAASIGPRLAATLGYLAGSHRVSQRGLEEITQDVFDVPVSVGTVANLQAHLSDALAPAHAEALGVVRAAAVKHADET